MASRFSVEAVFRMTDRISRPLRRISRGVDRFGNQARSSLRGVGEFLSRTRVAWAAVGAAAAAAGVAMVAVLRDVIETGVEFDRVMGRAAARFGIARTSEDFAALSEAAMEAGRTTEFSATQASEALAALGAAGFDARQSVAALPGTVDLATAAGLELGEATSRAADTLNQWGLMSSDSAELATNLARANDVLAAASTSANLTMTDLSDAYRDAAPAARAAGVSLEQTSAMIDVLAEAGIRGAQAGTAIRGVLGRLNPTTRRARAAFRDLGVATQDAEGNLRPAFDVLTDLRGAMESMGTADRGRALRNIFGEERATAGQNLINGIDRAREFERALEGAGGAAAEMASTIRDSAGGDLDSFSSTLEGLKLQLWDSIREPVREIVQAMTEWVRANQDWISGGFNQVAALFAAHLTEIAIVVGVVAAALAVLAVVVAVLVAAAVVTLTVLFAVAVAIPTVIAAAVAGIVAAAVWLYEAVVGAFEAVRARALEIWTAIREFIVGLFVVISRAAAPYLRPVLEAFAAVAAWVRERWAPIGAFFGRLWSAISSGASSQFASLMDFVKGIAARVREAWEPVRAFFAELWSSIATGFNEQLGGVIDAVTGFVGSTRAAGREEMGRQAGGGDGPQVATGEQRLEQVLRETVRHELDINVRDPGGRADVEQPRRGGIPVRVARSGA